MASKWREVENLLKLFIGIEKFEIGIVSETYYLREPKLSLKMCIGLFENTEFFDYFL